MDPLVLEEEEWKHLLPEVSDVVDLYPEVADLVLWATYPAMTPPPLCRCPPPPLTDLKFCAPFLTPDDDCSSFGERDWTDLVAAIPSEALEPIPVTKKRKREDKELYVKKPPNAFMLYLRSQRKTVEEELGIRNSAAINRVLSERWKSLAAEKREVFQADAQVEAHLHALRNPGWSNKVNYGKKSKKSKSKAPRLPPPSC